MARFMDDVKRGLATINVKTTTMMERNKYKTGISTKESEIAQIEAEIGHLVYENRNQFDLSVVQDKINEIDEKYAAIATLQQLIDELDEQEKEILGANAQAQANPQGASAEQKIFCTNCGAPNKMGYKFCEKCGNPLA